MAETIEVPTPPKRRRKKPPIRQLLRMSIAARTRALGMLMAACYLLQTGGFHFHPAIDPTIQEVARFIMALSSLAVPKIAWDALHTQAPRPDLWDDGSVRFTDHLRGADVLPPKDAP